jgi:hypothetical protein
MQLLKKIIAAISFAALALPMPGKAANSDLVLVQLTPTGWQVVTQQLLALTTGVISGNGNATTILNNINLSLLPGTKFCIGYGNNPSADPIPSAILAIPGAAATSGGVPCVMSGGYTLAPQQVEANTSFRVNASTVGIAPAGLVSLSIDGQLYSTQQIAHARNMAVQTVNFDVSLTPGWHQIAYYYSGDTQNPASQSNVAWVYAAPPAAPAPTIYINRSQSPLIVGQTHTATWSATNADWLYAKCTSTGTGYQGEAYMPLNGAHTMVNPAEWAGYPIHCVWTASGPGGTATAEEWIYTSY